MTLKQLKGITKAGLYASPTRTLYLNVAPGGSRSWVQRLTINGKRHHVGLGSCSVVNYTLASAKAMRNLVAIHDGRNPIAEAREAQRQAKIPTFSEAMALTFESLRSRWSSAKTAAKWRGLLVNYAVPLMAKRVDAITQQDVLTVLLPVYKTAPDSACRLRQNVRAVLAHAEAQGFVSRNVAAEAIDGALPTITKAAKRHHDALPHTAAADVFAAVSGDANVAASLLLRFIMLTAVRFGEAAGATWGEIDLDAATWIVPAEHMKTGAEHRVPLSPAAVELLTAAQDIADGSGNVFPSPYRSGGLVSREVTIKLLRSATNLPATIHGLRSTFRDWCAETGRNREVAERALAHAIGGEAEQAYFRSDLFEPRAALMASWANYCTNTRAKVVSIAA